MIIPDVVIAQVLMDSGTGMEIARRYKLSLRSVHSIKRRETETAWKVAVILERNGKKLPEWNPGRSGAKRFSDDVIRMIRSNKKSSYRLAKELGCAPATIRLIRQRKTYRDVE